MPYKFRTNTFKRVDVVKQMLVTLIKVASAVATNQDVPVKQNTTPKYVMKNRTIWIWEQEHTVQLPEDFDIYQGLRLFYPDLYQEVLKEQEYINYQQEIENEIIDNYLDYQEWLCD